MVSIPASGGHYVILNPDVTLTKYSPTLVPGLVIPVNAGGFCYAAEVLLAVLMGWFMPPNDTVRLHRLQRVRSTDINGAWYVLQVR